MSELRVYTPEEVAELLKVTRRAVYKYLAEGRLHAAKLSDRAWRITEDDIRAFLAANTPKRGEHPGADQKGEALPF